MIESQDGCPPRLDDVAFGVATGPNPQGRWFPFEPGEVYLVDRRDDWDGTPSGRELAGDGRRPWKYSVQREVFDTLAEAKMRSAEVKAAHVS